MLSTNYAQNDYTFPSQLGETRLKDLIFLKLRKIGLEIRVSMDIFTNETSEKMCNGTWKSVLNYFFALTLGPLLPSLFLCTQFQNCYRKLHKRSYNKFFKLASSRNLIILLFINHFSNR